MMPRLASLLVIAAFALAPLAQAVDCVMHAPVVPQVAGEHPMHDHADHATNDQMAVADCFAAAMHGLVGGETAFHAPALPAVLAEPAWRAALAPAPLRVAMAPWRAPPRDVLMTNQRRRI